MSLYLSQNMPHLSPDMWTFETSLIRNHLRPTYTWLPSVQADIQEDQLGPIKLTGSLLPRNNFWSHHIIILLALLSGQRWSLCHITHTFVKIQQDPQAPCKFSCVCRGTKVNKRCRLKIEFRFQTSPHYDTQMVIRGYSLRNWKLFAERMTKCFICCTAIQWA